MVNMMSRLLNKVAIVTGASKGIGGGVAMALGAAGARVAVNYSSDRKGAERIVEATLDNGGKAIAVGADVSKAADVERLFKEVDSACGRLDVLVNNAGVFRFGALGEITEKSFHLHFNINVLGASLTVQEAVKRFGADGGSIINLSSIVGSHPVAGVLLYASTNNVSAGTLPLGRLGRVTEYRATGSVLSVRRISLDHWGSHSCRRRSRRGYLNPMPSLPPNGARVPSKNVH
jgi:3-oxoacyl-[acyl-carrier protein] reductase